MATEEANDHTADLWPRCEFGSTPFGEATCPRHGEVRLDGSLLCVPHARLLRLRVRENVLLGEVLEMDKWLDDPDNRAEQLRWRRVLRQRDEAVEQLRFNRTLIEAHRGRDR